MILSKYKWVTLTIAIIFAILQALQPFIHSHLDVNHPIHHTGFHVGDEYEEVSTDISSQINNHVVSNMAHVSHTVSVASGIKQDLSSVLAADIVGVVIFCLYFASALLATLKFYPALSLIFYNSLKRRLPASRAPPQF